jgi:two-component system response regulator AtoC
MPESQTIHTSPPPNATPGYFVGSASRTMATLEGVAAEIAGTNIPVLIAGESGTGKQVLARRIHEFSARQASAMFRVVCGTLTAETLGSQLRLAERKLPVAGTVIFDEIGDLERECQRKLLHALPDGEHSSPRELLCARIISTTTQNLEDEVRAGRFRGDLYYRINGVCLKIPPLRDRREDIPLLIDYFTAKHAPRFGRSQPFLSSATISRLADHDWPGNVRELENVVMKILAIGNEEVALADFSAPPDMRAPHRTANGHSLKAAARAASREAERELILKALERTRWNRKRAAQELQVSYKSLLYKLKQIGLPTPEGE